MTIGCKVKLKSGSPMMTVVMESEKKPGWWICAFVVKEAGVYTTKEWAFPAEALEAVE